MASYMYNGVPISNPMIVSHNSAPGSWNHYSDIYGMLRAISMAIAGILTAKYVSSGECASEAEAESKFLHYKDGDSIMTSNRIVFKSCSLNDPTQIGGVDTINQWLLDLYFQAANQIFFRAGSVTQVDPATGNMGTMVGNLFNTLQSGVPASGHHVYVAITNRGITISVNVGVGISSGCANCIIQRPVNKFTGEVCMEYNYPVFFLSSSYINSNFGQIYGGLVKGNLFGAELNTSNFPPIYGGSGVKNNIMFPFGEGSNTAPSVVTDEEGSYILPFVSGLACNNKFYLNYEMDMGTIVAPMAFNSDIDINMYGKGLRRYTLSAPHVTSTTHFKFIFLSSGGGMIQVPV